MCGGVRLSTRHRHLRASLVRGVGAGGRGTRASGGVSSGVDSRLHVRVQGLKGEGEVEGLGGGARVRVEGLGRRGRGWRAWGGASARSLGLDTREVRTL